MRIFGIALSIIVVVVLLLVQATHSTAKSVYLPSELVQEKSIARLRLVGRVAEAPIEYKTEPTLLLTFYVTNPPTKPEDALHEGAMVPTGDPVKIRAEYNGVRPDMFAVGRDVILEGEYRDNTVFVRSLMTQCPSKYEAPDPAGTVAQNDNQGQTAY